MNLESLMFFLANNGNFAINTNILETNLVNQLILITGLIFIGRDLLGNTLNQRQIEIIANVQDSEKRLAEAQSRLEDAKKQLAQTRVLIDDIKNEAFLVQTKLLDSSYNQAKSEVLRKLGSAIITLQNRERLILKKVTQQISFLALEKVIQKIQEHQGNEQEQIKYMDARINMLKNISQD